MLGRPDPLFFTKGRLRQTTYNTIILSFVVIKYIKQFGHQKSVKLLLLVLVISQYEYDILVITRVRGEAEDEC